MMKTSYRIVQFERPAIKGMDLQIQIATSDAFESEKWNELGEYTNRADAVAHFKSGKYATYSRYDQTTRTEIIYGTSLIAIYEEYDENGDLENYGSDLIDTSTPLFELVTNERPGEVYYNTNDWRDAQVMAEELELSEGMNFQIITHWEQYQHIERRYQYDN